MSGKGWIRLHRSLQEHWIWRDKNYARWWLTILLNVNHDQTKFPVGDQIYTCNPGESYRSIEEWRRLYGCSKKTVVKFFILLKNDGMIETKILGKGNRRKHLLTVINWDKYQQSETENYLERKPKCALNGNRNVPPNNNEKNFNNEKNENSLPKQEKKIDPYQELTNEWLEYKKGRKESYKSQKSVDLFTKNLKTLSAGDPDLARQIIDQSMANNWAGIFPLKNNGKNGTRDRSGLLTGQILRPQSKEEEEFYSKQF